MKELIGKTITKIKISEEDTMIAFYCSDGKRFVYDALGECCSTTWFADITGIEDLLNQEVLSVENLEVPWVEDGRCRQEYDEFYGISVKTIKGNATFIYRNSSNGAYSGRLELYKPQYENGKQLGLPYRMYPILNDWQADCEFKYFDSGTAE